MLNNLNLKVKIFAFVTAVVVVTFLAVIWIVTTMSTNLAKRDAYNLAAEMADKYKNEIKAELQGARVTSETLATVFGTLKDHGLTDRDMMNDILKNALKQKEYITAFCIAYAPDALDGKDALYAGHEPEYDKTGRYAPYWNKLGESIAVEPLYDIDIADWWIVPRDTKKEFITDPYPYMVQGNEVMLESLVFPIIHKGEFIGIISSDIVLDKLQDMVTRVAVNNTGAITQIFSNSGIVAAHPDKRYLAKDVTEAFVFNMLAADPSFAEKALSPAEKYLRDNPLEENAGEEQVKIREGLETFVQQLGRYAANHGDFQLDIALLSPEMAMAILGADQKQLQHANDIKNSINGGVQHIDENYRDYYTVYMPIRFSEVTNPWSVAVSFPIADVLKNANEIRNFLLIMSLVAVCIIAVLLYWIARNISRPVLELAAAAEKIGEGNFNVNLPAVRGNNEISVLTGAFKTMAVKIDDLIHKLQDYAQELREKNENLEHLNESLTVARDQAEKSSRAKSDFLSNMSHEMRTPLNAIIGMINIGKSSGELARKDYTLGKIEDASVHLLGVINDVLDMSKIEAGKLELSPLDFVFENMIQKVFNVINFRVEEKHQSLRISIDDKIPQRLFGDDQRLSQVLTNLLSNAVKFTPDEGFIHLSTHFTGEENGVCTLLFEVRDTGIGISPEQQEQLFTSFQQADNSTSRKFGGTGLGLAISKRIVEMMNGRIWIESKLGKGSTFSFTVQLACSMEDDAGLPNHGVNMSDRQVNESAGIDACGEEAPGDESNVFAGRCLLLAEDLEINREIVLALLAPTEIVIECAVNGLEAVRMFSENPGRYDIVFMDVQMPLVDGYEATRQIRTLEIPQAKTVPIVAMTANVFKEDVEKCLAAGMNDHIGKPLDFGDVLKKLRTYLGKRK